VAYQLTRSLENYRDFSSIAASAMPIKFTKPENDLRRELGEVARDAEALRDVLNQNLNVSLPPDFPRDRLLEMTRSLAELPEGTAAGCRAALEYARNRLPAIRREHVIIEGEQQLSDIDSTPPLVRGALIDQRMRDLIASVTTALDEYRRIAGDEEPDESQPETATAVSSNSTREALAKSEKLDGGLTDAKRIVEETTRTDSSNADTLKRQITDAQGLNRLARVELQMPKVVVSWYRRTINALKDYPTLIKKTAGGLKDSADIVHIGLERWHDFKQNGATFLVDEFKKTCDTLVVVADRLDQLRQTNVDGVPPPHDFDPQVAQEMIVAGKTPPEAWWPFIHRIRTTTRSRKTVKTLTPMAGLKNLWSVDLHQILVDDLTPLANKTNLKILNLTFVRAHDVNALAGLSRVNTLGLKSSQVKDISGLGDLPELECLDLSYARHITDFRPLTKLPKLHELDISWCEISDFSFLAGCTQLTKLNLYKTSLSDLNVISRLRKLRELDISWTKVKDLAPLTDLKNLESLDLWGTKVRSLQALTDLTNLTHLVIGGTKVRSVKPLSMLISLEYLDPTDTLIEDLSPLDHLPELRVEGARRRIIKQF
jgi:hypothetical protein